MTDWTVNVAMRRRRADGQLAHHTFTTTIPATSEAYAFIGATAYGRAIIAGSNRVWGFDEDAGITVQPAATTPTEMDRAA